MRSPVAFRNQNTPTAGTTTHSPISTGCHTPAVSPSGQSRCTRRRPAEYATRTDYAVGQSVPLVLDGTAVAQLPVADLLP